MLGVFQGAPSINIQWSHNCAEKRSLVGRVVHSRRGGLLSLRAEQGQLDGLGDIFKEGSPVLLLALLDPVPVDAEGTGIYQLAHPLEGVGVAQ